MTNDVTTSRCPYCLQTKPGSTPATLSLPKDAQEDILDAEIERVEKLISSLFLERSKLYRKRNEMRSPIYSLPQEILTLIFKFTCPPLNFLEMYGLDSYDPDVPRPRIIGVMAAVSVYWHNVVSSTPSLWTSFVADDHDINAMQAIFSRSSNLPVIASLGFPVDSELRKPHAAILAPILQKYASRVRMLHVYNVSPAWLKKHIPSFAHLELLCLNTVHAGEDESFVIDGTFTGLILKDLSCYISLPWSQIEVLHISDMLVDDCLELLMQCTHLREYRLRGPSDSSYGGGLLPSSPFILPCLELFEWMVSEGDPVDRAMMQYIRMPALRTLVWTEESVVLESSTFLSTFFEHLPPTLSAVEVQNSAMRSDFSIFSYFLNLSNVEHLTFRKCSDRFMDSVFSDLGSKTCLVGNQEMPVLPKLKSIYVDCVRGNLDQAKILQTLGRSCSQLLEPLPGSLFRLEFAKHQVAWTLKFKEELIRMVEEGYQVEIWEDSKPVDWLPSRSEVTTTMMCIV